MAMQAIYSSRIAPNPARQKQLYVRACSILPKLELPKQIAVEQTQFFSPRTPIAIPAKKAREEIIFRF